MTLEIGFLLVLLAAMVYCFMTEVLPIELTAFIGLLVLVIADYVPVAEAFLGFSSPAVITMFAIFFISAALLETGVADWVGGKIHDLVGSREVPLIVLLMVVAGVLSAFMNNVAAAAVLLPAVTSLARRAGLSPGRLLMPLSFGAILGGTTTLVGTPPNILTAEVLANRGLEPFSLFAFTPIGLALLGVGVLFMITAGRRLLPAQPTTEGDDSVTLTGGYRVKERLTSIRIPDGSTLIGRSLRDTRIGTTLDVKVMAVRRAGTQHLAPPPDFSLAAGDELLVEGRFADLRHVLMVQGLTFDDTSLSELDEASWNVRGMVLRLAPGSGLLDRTARELRFRDRFDCLVVGIRRDGDVLRRNLASEILRGSDEIFVLGEPGAIERMAEQAAFEVIAPDVPPNDLLREGIFRIQVAAESAMAGRTIENSRMGELVGLTLIGIVRDGETLLAVTGDEVVQAGDHLLIAGDGDRVLELLQLGDLRLERASTPGGELQSDDVGLTEAIVAPRASIAGSSPRQLHFRDRYGLQMLALWREGKAIHKGLAEMPLRFGDALLLHGSREKIRHLGEDSDFVVLARDAQASRQPEKAWVALSALGLMIAMVLSGYFPIHVAAFAGAIFTVLFGALTMEKAYRAVEWRAIYLVAAILPVGIAMESSGAARFIADSVAALAGPYGPHAFLAALVVLSSLLSQSLDGAPTVVIMAPVVLLSAEQLGISPYPLMMGVGLAASAAFMTPFSHKANLLVMSAGGYRAMDYVKVGSPLTLAVFVILVFLVPLFFPF